MTESRASVEAEERARVLDVARTWIGTPFHNCASVKGAGVDCAHFLAAVFAEAGLIEPITIEPYSPQFMLHCSEEKFAATVLQYAHPIEEAAARPGDVVLYRVGRSYAHGAIVVDWPGKIIHAHLLSGCVIETGAFDADLRGRKVQFYSRWC